jgi:hypothetical protein
MALNPNIALGVRPLELPNQLAQYGQLQQIMAAQDAQQMNALKMQEAQAAMEERNALRRLNPSAPDYESQLFKVSPQLGISYRKEAATTAAQKAAETKSLTEAAAAKQKMLGQAYRDISGRPSDANITAHLEDIAESTLYSDAEKAAITKRGTALLAMPFAERQMYLAQQGATASELKPSTQTINRGGATDIVRVPAFGGAPTTASSYADVPLPADVQAQKMQTARAGATNLTVSTERKYGDRFGGLIAEADAAKLSAAENAPRMAENADRITDLLATGKVITGTGANVRLQIAKALNLAGGTDSERIKNTEVLVSSLAETTLGAIKASNLGAGQGFTNADRDFLEKAVAGQLSYDDKSLAELARLSRRAAEKSAESWNKRSASIPKSALEGTGISTEPVVIPPRKVSSVMNIPAGAITDLKSGKGSPEQFDAVFGAGSAKRILGEGK